MSANAPSLLVQGWTGINHSYAMVNQYQLLEFLKSDKVRIYHSEAPYFSGEWSRDKIGAGFPPEDARRLADMQPYAGEQVSGIYRIHTPNTLAPASVPVITFLVTEFGLDDKTFVPGADVAAYVRAGNRVVTPSAWSRQRIVEYGFAEESVYVVPHGVDGQRFSPMGVAERQGVRAALGYGEDDVVLLNVGAPLWNKGMDLLLEAFVAARRQHKNLRLLIKDQQALYGMTAVKMLQNMVAEGRIRCGEGDVEAISVIPQTLTIDQLRGLYCVADYYVSPYRAEGFNLPVIEALACGTPVIVTAGGSTDDFCDSNTSIRIPATFASNLAMAGQVLGGCLLPDLNALVEIIGRCARHEVRLRERMAFGRADLLEKFTWRRATSLITALL